MQIVHTTYCTLFNDVQRACFIQSIYSSTFQSCYHTSGARWSFYIQLLVPSNGTKDCTPLQGETRERLICPMVYTVSIDIFMYVNTYAGSLECGLRENMYKNVNI